MRLLLFVPLLALVLSFTACSDTVKEKQRPNIVFIMSDDHAYQAISAYSDHLIQTPNIDRIADEGMTPNIDRIADEGMLFSNACVSNSICAPSRATILTGKHSHLHGKIDNIFPFDTTQLIFPQLFQDAGYQTAMFGKLHFGNNPKGIDEFKILPGQGARIEGYTTDVITDLTMDWMKNRRDPEKPFLLFYLHKAPHRNWLPAERHYKEFTKQTFPEPSTLFDDYEGRGTAAKEAEMNILLHQNWAGDSKLRPDVMDELGITPASKADQRIMQNTYRRFTEEQLAAWNAVYDPITEDFKERYPAMTEKEQMSWKYQRYMQDYLGCIAAVDDGVGTVLDYLDEAGLTENTIVVYTSDQGFYLGEHGWFDKRFIYDESFKTPLLVRWPGTVQPGSKNDEMVQNMDFAQTFLDIAGIESPSDMQGESIVPLLKGDVKGWDRDAVYYHYYEYPGAHMVKRHYGIVTREYKLAHFYYDVDEWELYDRKNDPMEMQNEYNNPEYADVVAELKEKLTELRVKYGDSEELDQKFIDLYTKK